MATIDQQQTIHSATKQQIYGSWYESQTFQSSLTGNLTTVKLYPVKIGSPANFIVEIQGVSGGKPDGNILASEEISAGSIGGVGAELTVDFSTPTSIVSGTSYSIVVHQKADGGTYNVDYYMLYGGLNNYANGLYHWSIDSGSSWTNSGQELWDLYFKTYVEPPILLDQEQSQKNSFQIINTSNFRVAQTFQAGISGTLKELKLWGYKAGYSSGDFIIEIRNTIESHSKPDSTVLGSGTFSNSDLATTIAGAEFVINLSTPAENIVANNYYSIVVRRTSVDGGCAIFYQNTDVYADGNYVYSTDGEASWHVNPYDMYFKTYMQQAIADQKTILANASITGTEQKTILSDAIISDQYDITVSSDASILSTEDKTILSDANIKAVGTQATILSDAKILLLGTGVKSIKSDAVIADILSVQIISDAHIAAKRDKTILSDAHIRGDAFTHINTDIRFLVPEYKDINTDIRYSTDLSKFKKTDIYIQEGYYIPAQTVHIITTLSYYQWRFKNEVGGTWSSWENIDNGEKEWDVTAGNGIKKIYYEFKTAGGLILSEVDFYLECYLNTDAFSILNLKAYEVKNGTEISDSTYQPDNTVYFDWDTPLHLVPIKGYSYAIDGTPDEIINIPQPSIVISGMDVEEVSGMIVKVNDGIFYNNLDRITYTSQNFTIEDSEDLDRIDVIYIDLSDNVIRVSKGTKGVDPDPATIPANSNKLAEIRVRAATTEILNSDITDSRITKVALDYTDVFLTEGQHTLKIKAQALNGLWSNLATFNLWISSLSPDLTDLKCYVSEGGTEIINGQLQNLSDSGYFEWVAPDAPGDMTYYYTIDGSEPTSTSDNTTDTHVVKTMGTGSHIFKVRAKDQYGTWGRIRQFTFVYSAVTYSGDTIVISNGTILSQSLKEVIVNSIRFSLDSARVCEFEEPVDFDSSGSFSYGQIVSVIHNENTLFTGRIRVIRRSISINNETIHYQAAGPRAELEQIYSYTTAAYGETHILTFRDVSPTDALDQILAQVTEIVSGVSGTVSADNIKELELTTIPTAQAVTEILKSAKNYKYYIEPDGTLNFIDLTAVSGKDVYFGIYGQKISTSSPQFNVVGSNLVFDNTNRYNQCIVQGSRKIEIREVECYPLKDETKDWGYDYTKWCLPDHWKVVKLLNTKVSFVKAMSGRAYRKKAFLGQFKKVVLNPEAIPEEQNTEWVWEGYHDMGYLAVSEFCSNSKYQKITQRQWMKTKRIESGTEDTPPTETEEWKQEAKRGAVTDFEKGSLEPKYKLDSVTEMDGFLVKFNKWIYNKPTPASTPTPGTVIALVAVETEPLVVSVSLSGSAVNPKILRIYDSSYIYDKSRFFAYLNGEKVNIEYDWKNYPDNLPALFIDDTDKILNRANKELVSKKDIVISGSVTLDTIDNSWNLRKTVNLQNTEQGDWESLNARIISITYNFMDNTTTLQLTTQYST